MLLVCNIIFDDKHARCIDIEFFCCWNSIADSAKSGINDYCIHVLSLCSLKIKVIFFPQEVSEFLTKVSINRRLCFLKLHFPFIN